MAPEKRLPMLYLANHILQEGKKKGREFTEEYGRVMAKALREFTRNAEAKAHASASRMVKIWEERRVFSTALIKTFKDGLQKTVAPAPAAKTERAPSIGEGNKLQVGTPLY